MSGFGAYLLRCGLEFDIAINVLTGGKNYQTVSFRTATAASMGGRPACILCWFLNWAVERNHCARSLAGDTSSTTTVIRASIAFGVGILAVTALLHLSADIVGHFL